MRTRTDHIDHIDRPRTTAPTGRFRAAGAAAVATVAAAALTLTGCGAIDVRADTKSWTESTQAAEAGVSPVVLLGDSVAAGQAVALGQGLAESGVEFVDETSTGGGNLVGPNAREQWKSLPDRLDQAADGVVLYQLTTYDWGTPQRQRAGYERLAETTAQLDADLILVSMPPIEPDEFYRPHMDELVRADQAARDVADDLDTVEYLDATEVWGDAYTRKRDGTIDRSSDGIHTCPLGAARFTAWMLDELAGLYPGFTPASVDRWANTGWSDNDKFHGC